MHPYARVIVCPIFDRTCLKATLRCAGYLAKCSGARLLVLDIKDLPRSRERPGEPGANVRRLEPNEAVRLDALEGVNYERYELLGEPTSGICDFVESHDADIVVLGNDVGIEGAASLGKLTRDIANGLSCNVMIVKEPDCVEHEGFAESTANMP